MKVTDLINEMARSDLAGAEDAIKAGDMDKVASHYVKKAKERGMDAKKIVAGLGATFRTFEEITPEQISELKTKVKELVSGEMPPKKEKSSKKKEKKEEGEEEDEGEDASVTAAKASTKSKQKTVLLKKKAEEGLGEAYYPTERERILMNAGMLNERTMGVIESDNRSYGKKVGGRGTEGDSFGKKKKGMKVKGVGVGSNASSEERTERKFGKSSTGKGDQNSLVPLKKFAMKTSQANQNIPNNPVKTGKNAKNGLTGGSDNDQDSLAPKLHKKFAKKIKKFNGVKGEPSQDNLSLIDKPGEPSLAQKAKYRVPKEHKSNVDGFGGKIGKLSGR